MNMRVKNQGRPQVPIDGQQIEEAIAEQDTVELACKSLGYSYKTLYDRMKKDTDLARYVYRGQVRRKARIIDARLTPDTEASRRVDIIREAIGLGINSRSQLKSLLGYSYDAISKALDQVAVGEFVIVDIAGVEHYFPHQAAADEAIAAHKRNAPPPLFKPNGNGNNRLASPERIKEVTNQSKSEYSPTIEREPEQAPTSFLGLAPNPEPATVGPNSRAIRERQLLAEWITERDELNILIEALQKRLQ